MVTNMNRTLLILWVVLLSTGRVCAGEAIICTGIDTHLHVMNQARALFLGTATGQAFWFPTMKCLEQMALAAGFTRVEKVSTFDLKSVECTRDYNEVKRVGAFNSTERTEDQTAIARFWPGGGANVNAVARLIVADRGLDLWEHARLFALVNMAVHDSAVSVYDTNYTYNFWRPVTAIRAGDTDGNHSTVADSEWISFLNTPPYPDYTCGLTTNVGAGSPSRA